MRGRFFFPAGIKPNHPTDAGNQDDHADAGPDDGAAGWGIADERLRREVARVRNCVAGTIRG